MGSHWQYEVMMAVDEGKAWASSGATGAARGMVLQGAEVS